VAGKVSGLYVAVTAGGAVLVWSGWKGATLAATLGSLLRGNLNAPDTESVAASSASGSASGASGAGDYGLAQLQALWTSNGGDAATAFEAAQVALAESSGNPEVTSANPDGGTNVGLWQLDTRGVGAGYTVAQLQDPDTNARITIMASANGTSWTQWADSVVQDGVYVGPTETSLTGMSAGAP